MKKNNLALFQISSIKNDKNLEKIKSLFKKLNVKFDDYKVRKA